MDRQQQSLPLLPPKKQMRMTQVPAASTSTSTGVSRDATTNYFIQGSFRPAEFESLVTPTLSNHQNLTTLSSIHLKHINLTQSEFESFIKILKNCTCLISLRLEDIECSFNLNFWIKRAQHNNDLMVKLPKLMEFELSISKFKIVDSSDKGNESEPWKIYPKEFLKSFLFFCTSDGSWELQELLSININVELKIKPDTSKTQYYLKLNLNTSKNQLDFLSMGIQDDLIHEIMNGPENSQYKHVNMNLQVRNCFFQHDNSLNFNLQAQQRLTCLVLENIAIESQMLIKSLDHYYASLNSIKLLNIVLFGSCQISMEEKLQLKCLKYFQLHLNHLYDEQNEEDDPELLSNKIFSLLFFCPAHGCEIQIKIFCHDEGYWQDYFTIIPSDATVFTAIEYNPMILPYIEAAVDNHNLKDLTLFNCQVQDLDLIPISTLSKLTLSSIQLESVRFKQLLARISTSPTLETLVIRNHGTIQLSELTSSQLKHLTFISTEIETTTIIPSTSSGNKIFNLPFPNLSSVSLIDCNLSEDFTPIYQYYFPNATNIHIQEFPISCKLLYFILQEAPMAKNLKIAKFDLKETWEARASDGDPNDEGADKYFKFMHEFCSKQGIELRPNLSFELEKLQDSNNWKVNWSQVKSRRDEDDEVMSKIKTNVELDNYDAEVHTLGILNSESSNFDDKFELLQSKTSLCEKLRIIQLSSLDYNAINLKFLQYCPNLIILTLEYMKCNDYNQLITNSSSLLALPRVSLTKLEKFELNLSIKNIPVDNVLNNMEGVAPELLESLIWFTKEKQTNNDRRPSKLEQIFNWKNTSINIAIKNKTLFEFSWKAGLINLSRVTNGSNILNKSAMEMNPDPDNNKFVLKTLYLKELQVKLPNILQPTLEVLTITNCNVDYNILANSILHCENLNELNLKEVQLINIPEGQECGFLRNLKKLSYTKSD